MPGDNGPGGGAAAPTAGAGPAAAGADVASRAAAAGLPTPQRLDIDKATVLSIELGPRPGQVGITAEHVGGIGIGGPTLLAANEAGDLCLYDAARARIILYQGGEPVQFFAVPFLQDPLDLRLNGTRLTVVTQAANYVLDVSGTTPRILEVSWGSGSTGGGGVDHPEPYAPLAKGATLQLALDAYGNHYDLTEGAPPVLRRVSPTGQELAAVSLAGVAPAQDYAYTRNGAVYALVWDYTNGFAARVIQVMHAVVPHRGDAGNSNSTTGAADAAGASDATNASGANGGAAAPGAGNTPDDTAQTQWPAPVAFSRPVPTALHVTSTAWPALTITDPVVLQNLWWLLSSGRELQQVPKDSEMPSPRGTFALEASFATGTPMYLTLNETGVAVAKQWYAHGGAWQLLRVEALGAAGGLKSLLDNAAVTVQLTDLPGVGRPLSGPERSELARLATDAFLVTGAEPPDPLDPAFPRYSVTLNGAGWTNTLIVLQGGYACLGPYAGWQSSSASGLFLGQLPDLQPWLERVVPPPAAGPGDLAYLYGAQGLRISVDGGPFQDLTRWQRRVARLLLGAAQPGGEPAADSRQVRLVFRVHGGDEVVDLNHNGFDYAGAHYGSPGLVGAIIGLLGVP